jgi:hypothetical protein
LSAAGARTLGLYKGKMHPRLIPSLELLRDQLFNGWVELILAEESLIVINSPEFVLFRNILSIIHITNTDYTLLEISKIISKNQDSVQMNYLLNLLEEEARISRNDELLGIVTSHKVKISEYKEIIDQIVAHRDKRIAHLDRILLDPNYYIEKLLPINMEKVEEVYIELEMILNVYCIIYKCSTLNIEGYELAFHKEWGIMLTRLRNDVGKVNS